MLIEMGPGRDAPCDNLHYPLVLLVEHFPDGCRNLPLREGLHRRGPDGCRLCCIGIDHIADARAHDDGHIGSEGEGLFGKVDARRSRHSLVGHDKIEPAGIHSQERESLVSVHPGCYLVAEFREDIFAHLREGLFVIDEENALGARGLGMDEEVKGFLDEEPFFRCRGGRTR